MLMFFKKNKTPNELKTWKEVYLYCSKIANQEQRPIKEVLSNLPDDIFQRFDNIVYDTAYTYEKVWFGEDIHRPKMAAESFCFLMNTERDKRHKRQKEEQTKEALECFGKDGGSRVVVEESSFSHSGWISTRQGLSTPEYSTLGYRIYLEHNGNKFEIGVIDTRKKAGVFIEPSKMTIQKSSQDFVKKHMKEVLDVSEIKKPEDEKAALTSVLLDGQQNKDLLNYYVYRFMLQKCQDKEKQVAKQYIKENKIKEKIRTRVTESRRK